jgi:hypothetical protein
VKIQENLAETRYLEIISIDFGPGISNVEEMMKDGVSTSHTLGQGLGSIKRLSDDFDIYSLPNWGTILLSRVYVKQSQSLNHRMPMIINTLMIPKSGEEFCGDGWKALKMNHQYKLFALDGLGHGPNAAKAADKAVQEFVNVKNLPPAETIKELHQKIKGTRGGVGMIFQFDILSNSFSFAGLGNISARVIGFEKNKNCISYNGIIGHSIPNTLHNNAFSWQANEILVIHSDGLKSRWDFNNLPKILDYDGSVVAAALYKEFSRKTDDLLIIVLKNRNYENRTRKI